MREDLLLIQAPTLYRLMALRNALVALKGPLADDPALHEGLHRRLFDEDIDSLQSEERIDALRVHVEQAPFG
ncbi:hypothetical protein [Pseudomonas sp. PWP3-1b2]|uniref:hypothetical protein n=1 Tax=Pseudomonas sp. PWP3-1b2 TaxID=2804656 RepID=UPI003CF23D22